jgi:transposase-like protein
VLKCYSLLLNQRWEIAVAIAEVKCPICKSNQVVKFGLNRQGKQRYRCDNEICKKDTFILDYKNKGHLPEVKDKIIEMALNGSGIRDTSRVLGISQNTVISELKKINGNH